MISLALKSEFIDGKRVTDAATVEVVEMVLSGLVNKRIVQAINAQGGKAVGLSGKDAELMVCEAADPKFGFVGEPVEVNTEVLKNLFGDDMIPVIAPLGMGRNGETFNVNGDTAAGAIAGALKADRLLLLTNVAGVKNAAGELVTELTARGSRGDDAGGRDLGRDDSQDRDRAAGGAERGARLHHRGWPGVERGAAGAFHRTWCRLDDQGLSNVHSPYTPRTYPVHTRASQ